MSIFRDIIVSSESMMAWHQMNIWLLNTEMRFEIFFTKCQKMYNIYQKYKEEMMDDLVYEETRRQGQTCSLT